MQPRMDLGRKGNIQDMSEEGKRLFKHVVAAALAFLSGMVNVLFGGGGGMLVVPAMNRCLEVEEKRAHASAIAVMLPLSLLSAILYTMRGVGDLPLLLYVGSGAVVGAAIGAALLNKMPKRVLSFVFYGVMIYAGIKYLR